MSIVSYRREFSTLRGLQSPGLWSTVCSAVRGRPVRPPLRADGGGPRAPPSPALAETTPARGPARLSI